MTYGNKYDMHIIVEVYVNSWRGDKKKYLIILCLKNILSPGFLQNLAGSAKQIRMTHNWDITTNNSETSIIHHLFSFPSYSPT